MTYISILESLREMLAINFVISKTKLKIIELEIILWSLACNVTYQSESIF